MKLTRNKLRRIIKEELHRVLQEEADPMVPADVAGQTASAEIVRQARERMPDPGSREEVAAATAAAVENFLNKVEEESGAEVQEIIPRAFDRATADYVHPDALTDAGWRGDSWLIAAILGGKPEDRPTMQVYAPAFPNHDIDKAVGVFIGLTRAGHDAWDALRGTAHKLNFPSEA